MKIYSPAPPQAYQDKHGLKVWDALVLIGSEEDALKVWNLLWLVEPGLDDQTPSGGAFFSIDQTLDAIVELTHDARYDWFFADMAAGKLPLAVKKLSALQGYKQLRMTQLKGNTWAISALDRLTKHGHGLGDSAGMAYAGTVSRQMQFPSPPQEIPKKSGVVIPVNFRSR